MVAVLISAINDLKRKGWTKSEAFDWFSADRDDHLFCFVRVCEYLKLSHTAVRVAALLNQGRTRRYRHQDYKRNLSIRKERTSHEKLAKEGRVSTTNALLTEQSTTNAQTGDNTMPRLSSSLETVQDREALPSAVYRARIKEIKFDENGQVIKSQGANNPMLPFTFEVVEGEHKSRQFFTNIMIGGVQRDGQPMNTFMLLGLIDGFKLPWGCTNCHNAEAARPFLKGSGANGLEKGKYYCPDCKTPARITYDTDAWVASNHFADVKVGQEPSQNKDGSPKRDANGEPVMRNTVEGFSAIQ